MKFYQKFYPKRVFKNVLDITADFLYKNDIKAILLDIDNTVIDYDNKILEGIEDWVKELQEENIKFCILSNTRKKNKAERISKLLNIPYINFAKKPLKTGFEKARKKLGIKNNENIAVVGDQVMTDVYGANRSKMYSILVEPIQKKDILVTRFNRILERKILKKYYSENK